MINKLKTMSAVLNTSFQDQLTSSTTNNQEKELIYNNNVVINIKKGFYRNVYLFL